MRVFVTPLLTNGVKRPTRAAPIDAEMRSAWNEQHHHVLQLWEPERPASCMWAHLIHPQLAESKQRVLIFHGFERQDDGRLVAQAWEVEPWRR